MDTTRTLAAFRDFQACLILDGQEIAKIFEHPDGPERVLRLLSEAATIIQRLESTENKGHVPARPSREASGVEPVQGSPSRREIIVQGNEIVRRAWGKKVGAYEQRMGRDKFERIWKGLASLPADREFSPQDLIAASKVPNYQVYIALELLIRAQVLDSPRRGTYSTIEPKDLTLPFPAVWSRISS